MNKATFYKSGKYFEYRFHLFGSQSGFLKVRKVLEYIAILLAINSHTLKRDISREVTPTPQKMRITIQFIICTHKILHA